jgi:hypothetical protein
VTINSRSKRKLPFYFLLLVRYFLSGLYYFAILWLVVADELTSDYHDRTRLMVLQNSTGYVTKLISS